MSASGGRRTTEVAVGVMIRADGQVLLSDRPAGKAYGGYWEFPGGKIEPGETVAQALERELLEELGVQIGRPLPWVTFEFDYPHAYVRLHFCRVWDWTSMPAAREGQRWTFFDLATKPPAPLLPAAVPALRWLKLPDSLAIGRREDAPVSRALAACVANADGASPQLRMLRLGELRACNSRRSVGPVDAAADGNDGWTGAWIETAADLSLAASLGLDFAASNRGDLIADSPLPLFVPPDLWRRLRSGAAEGCAHGPILLDEPA